MIKVGVKAVVFICLFLVQVVVALVYKFSLTNGVYNYSTISAITMAEITKFCMSLYMTLWFSVPVREISTSTSVFTSMSLKFSACRREIERQLNKKFVLHTFILAVLYGINNQIVFVLYQYVDVVSISLFRSFTSFLSAILLWILFSRPINRIQWSAITLQVIGLIIVQYDACKKLPILEIHLYLILMLNCTITSTCTVWNEHLLKNYSVSLYIQNLVLYFFGFIINFCFFAFSYAHTADSPKGFFEGYSMLVLAVIFCNSILGLCITLAYKYADAIIKTFSSACATGAFLFLNWSLFNQATNLTSGLGAAIIFISSYVYFCAVPSSTTTRLESEPNTNQKTET